MIEKDLSHLRFLCVRIQKGEHLLSEDIAFIQDKYNYLNSVVTSLSECLETVREREKQL